jgi:Ca-activated chloride channel family protein
MFEGNTVASRRWIRGLLAVMLVAIVAGSSAVAQQRVEPPPPPEPPDEGDQSVELAANLVTLTVVVRDASGALVTDLEPADFTITEDGRRQDVDKFFHQGEIPLRLALLFDASISIKDRLDFEKRAAARFFADVLRPGDEASLVSISTEWRIEQPLTTSAVALTEATSRLTAAGITSLYGAVDGASKSLGEAQGRRVLVVLSDGYDTRQRESLAGALEAAQRSDAVIYCISPSGAGDDQSPAGRIGASALRRLADETGGRAFFPPIEEKLSHEAAALDDIYKKIIEELKAQYVITYYSTTSSADKGFRTIHVSVNRPGLTVSARKGYYPK